MEEIKGSASRSMWQRLAHIDPEVLANYLRNEYPQTVAVILSRIRPDHAARVLSILPDEFAIDVVNRMLKIDNVQKEALEHIEETLKSEFVTTFTQSARRDAHKTMAEVFNAFDRHTEARFLSALDQMNRDAAKKIRALMFTFEDLAKLDPGSIQTLMRQVDRETLSRALKALPNDPQLLLRQHVEPCGEEPPGRDGGHGPDPSEGRGRRAEQDGDHGEGNGRSRRHPDLQEPRRRGARLLMTATLRTDKGRSRRRPGTAPKWSSPPDDESGDVPLRNRLPAERPRTQRRWRRSRTRRRAAMGAASTTGCGRLRARRRRISRPRWKRLAQAAGALLGQIDRHQAETEGLAMDFALTLGRKLAGQALAREPLAAVADAAAQALQHLRGVPHLAVRVNDRLVEEVDTLLQRLARGTRIRRAPHHLRRTRHPARRRSARMGRRRRRPRPVPHRARP